MTTSSRTEFVDITSRVHRLVTESGIKEGMAFIFVPHTTAAVTINENADPDVVRDMVMTLDKLAPWDDPAYHHAEGNSAAHLKASLVGSSVNVMIHGGALSLGVWQGIYFCEFDGPRTRSVRVGFLESASE